MFPSMKNDSIQNEVFHGHHSIEATGGDAIGPIRTAIDGLNELLETTAAEYAAFCYRLFY
jgi:hypothetical protein